VAHEIANANRHMTVVGLPKTMDNDLVWVWQSFGFNSAVEKAAEVINTLHSEAASTRRVAVVELFGADSGFVAANAALASGHADLVLIPEVFKPLEAPECEQMLDQYVQHMKRAVNRDRKRPHGMVIVAEGVGRILLDKGATLAGKPIEKDATGKPKDFTEDLRQYLMGSLFDAAGNSVEVFVNRPQHHIRAGKANAHDQIYCERLGALAVDNALAGYTDFLVSQWLTEFVLVPLPLVVGKRKSIPPEGMFWKQVCSTTRQPAHLARVTVVTSTQP
jgi:6-phosphofructokinase 1